ncbi:9678_t:CDS:2 [Funneliformis caledonium]|uniref:Ribulose-phosphate 3-epimerase n=2 Tax=Funneliformis TaxID=1117308 RepID=A0A9N8WJP2_9GLOM|nr:9678_t:CDS:2 [Funneliformis caledonium]CAG8613245.1 16550_t:CDS:2 [Funneliformis mosseae]
MPIAKISPSMLSSDFASLSAEANRMVKNGADWLHMDVMDGHFVPNITIGAPVIQSLRKHTDAFLGKLPFDGIKSRTDDFAKAGASMYCFHIEATNEPEALIEKIKKAGMKVGVAVKPKTPIDTVYSLVDKIDMCLVKELREKFPELDIEVDGGLALDTIDQAVQAGANVIVAGTSVFKAENPKDVISTFREKVNTVQKS